MISEAELADKMREAEQLLREIVEALAETEGREEVPPVLMIAMRRDRRALDDAATVLATSLAIRDVEQPLSGAELRRIRKELGFKSCRELASVLGRATKTIERMERKGIIEDSKIIRLALVALGANL